MRENLVKENLTQISDALLYNAISEGKEVTMRTAGNSMFPLIDKNDYISFKKVEIKRLKKFDLIVFRSNNELIAHRFIKSVNRDGCIYLLTRSDTLREYDSPIQSKDFIGLVAKIKKADKIICLNTIDGKLRSYLNILLALPYSFGQKKANFKNENELLVLVSRLKLDESSLLRIKQLLTKSLNWDDLLIKARAAFLTPFILKNIINNNGLREKIPFRIKEQIRRNCSWRLSVNTKLYSSLEEVLCAFHQNNIKVAVIKGAQLGQEIYGDTSLRLMWDADILAKISDWPKIKVILDGLGFKMKEGNCWLWGLEYLDNHITFLRDGVKLELKFNLWLIDFPYFKHDFWQRARQISLNGQNVLVASIEDTLLIACANLLRHHYIGLVWFCDIREIIEKFKDKINWDIVKGEAKDNDLDSIVYYALYYSASLLNYEIPSKILQRLRPPFVKRILHNFFWDKRVILFKKEGHTQRAKIAFEIAALFFGGKFSLHPKKLYKMVLYIAKIITQAHLHLFRFSFILLESFWKLLRRDYV